MRLWLLGRRRARKRARPGAPDPADRVAGPREPGLRPANSPGSHRRTSPLRVARRGPLVAAGGRVSALISDTTAGRPAAGGPGAGDPSSARPWARGSASAGPAADLGRMTRQAAGRRRLGWGPGDGQAARGRRARGPAARVALDLGRPPPLARLAVTPGLALGARVAGQRATGARGRRHGPAVGGRPSRWLRSAGRRRAGGRAAGLGRPNGAGAGSRDAALGQPGGAAVVMLARGSRVVPGRITAERVAAGLRPGPSTGGGDWPGWPSARRRCRADAKRAAARPRRARARRARRRSGADARRRGTRSPRQPDGAGLAGLRGPGAVLHREWTRTVDAAGRGGDRHQPARGPAAADQGPAGGRAGRHSRRRRRRAGPRRHGPAERRAAAVGAGDLGRVRGCLRRAEDRRRVPAVADAGRDVP